MASGVLKKALEFVKTQVDSQFVCGAAGLAAGAALGALLPTSSGVWIEERDGWRTPVPLTSNSNISSMAAWGATLGMALHKPLTRIACVAMKALGYPLKEDHGVLELGPIDEDQHEKSRRDFIRREKEKNPRLSESTIDELWTRSGQESPALIALAEVYASRAQESSDFFNELKRVTPTFDESKEWKGISLKKAAECALQMLKPRGFEIDLGGSGILRQFCEERGKVRSVPTGKQRFFDFDVLTFDFPESLTADQRLLKQVIIMALITNLDAFAEALKQKKLVYRGPKEISNMRVNVPEVINSLEADLKQIDSSYHQTVLEHVEEKLADRRGRGGAGFSRED